jgi:hypothetical protein
VDESDPLRGGYCLWFYTTGPWTGGYSRLTLRVRWSLALRDHFTLQKTVEFRGKVGGRFQEPSGFRGYLSTYLIVGNVITWFQLIWLFGQTDFVFAGGGWAFGGEAAERRVTGWGDFDEVETETVCEGESFRDGQNAELFLFVADDLDFVGTNALVFPGRLVHRKQAKLRG